MRAERVQSAHQAAAGQTRLLLGKRQATWHFGGLLVSGSGLAQEGGGQILENPLFYADRQCLGDIPS
jgi:hypothetical protein